MGRFPHKLLFFLVFTLLTHLAFAQEKKHYPEWRDLTQAQRQYYYFDNPSSILPDAYKAFNDSNYSFSLMLCSMHYNVYGDLTNEKTEKDKLKEASEKCYDLINDIDDCLLSGDFKKAFEMASEILRLNPKDKKALEVKERNNYSLNNSIESAPSSSADLNHTILMPADINPIVRLIRIISSEFDIELGVTMIDSVKNRFRYSTTKKGKEIKINSKKGTVEISYDNKGKIDVLDLNTGASISTLTKEYGITWDSSYLKWDQLFVSLGVESQVYEPYYGNQSMLVHAFKDTQGEQWNIIIMFSGDRKKADRTKPFAIICSKEKE